MAKAILEFDLDDYSDRCSHKRAINATEAYIAISKIEEMFRSILKYNSFKGTELNDSEYELIEMLRNDVNYIVSDYVNTNDLE